MNTAELSYIELSWEGILVKIENTSEFIAIIKNFNQVFRYNGQKLGWEIDFVE